MFLRSIFTISRFLLIAMVVILYIHYFFPQSWGFFTIPPRQPLIDAYVVRNGVADKKRFFTNNMNYGMGICRKGIVIYTALIKLIRQNKNLVWEPLHDDSLLYLTKHGRYVSVFTGDPQGIYKGKF